MTEETTETAPAFVLQRIYLKDCSFEVPGAPDIFRIDWEPHIDLELHTNSVKLADSVYEVEVAITATAKVKDKIAFLIEVKQGGIFTISGIPEQQLPEILNIVCPNILFPYAREIISSMVTRGSFPQLLLDPINFEALYAQSLQQNAAKTDGDSESEVTTH